MTSDETCPRCNDISDSIMHMLRKCKDVNSFWTDLIQPNMWSKLFKLGLHSWLERNLSSNHIGLYRDNWNVDRSHIRYSGNSACVWGSS